MYYKYWHTTHLRKVLESFITTWTKIKILPQMNIPTNCVTRARRDMNVHVRVCVCVCARW